MAGAYEWLDRHPVGSDKTLGELSAIVSELRSTHGAEHVVTAGICWGGWYATALAATDKVGCAHSACLLRRASAALHQGCVSETCMVTAWICWGGWHATTLAATDKMSGMHSF